jgi:NAD-specific glutamate dehydrogenase
MAMAQNTFNEFIRNIMPDVKPTTFKVATCLCLSMTKEQNSYVCFDSWNDIQAKTGIRSQYTIGSALRELHEIQAITREQRGRLTCKFTLNENYKTKSTIKVMKRRKKISLKKQIDVYKSCGFRCVKCKSYDNLEIDHINPISNGGSNAMDNLQILCLKCNRAKGNSVPCSNAD